MNVLTPKEIVSELDKYIIGQNDAKRSVAIALRNRWRRQQVPEDLRDEIAPKNIIMIGPTGVGKTEIARRLAKLANAPFLKVEASKFTEVGYVGRDVESMIRDLTELAVTMVKAEAQEKVQQKARENAEERLLDLLLPPVRKTPRIPATSGEAPPPEEEGRETREKLRKMLREGKLDDRIVDLETTEKSAAFPMVEIISGSGMEEMEYNLKEMLGNIFPKGTKKRRCKVSESIGILVQEEAQKLVDMDTVLQDALLRVQESGIVFLDEIDKVASRDHTHGPDVSREGVQRDLLPIVEGTTVTTKYGIVKTDHILFIAAGAFHMSKPSDLIPELQGRFPIRVELKALSQEDLVRIITEPKNSLIKQYTALMETEEVTLTFDQEAISEIARIATLVNERSENIGARRLHTVMERLLDEISYSAPDIRLEKIVITTDYVREKLSDVVQDENLSKYIL